MSGLVGRGQISFRKKIVAESLIPALGIKKVRLAGINAAAIAPVNGIITLPFANFVPPPEMVAEGFSNPSSTEIVNLRLGQFRNNVQVSSNLNGVLLDQIAYTITDEALILQDSYMVTAGEIFVLTIDSNPVTCQRVVDARPLRASGTVDFSTIGSSPVTFPVGQGYRVAQSAVNSLGADTQQIGNVQVFVDGVLQLRNAGNADEDSTAAASQTGNYREIAINSSGTIIAGVDYANAIRFNQFQPFSATEGVLIVATNVIVDEPNGTGVLSLLDNIEMGVATNTTRVNRKEIFNLNVTGDFSSLATVAIGAAATAADNILSLAMDRASEAYTINSFVVTLTNEFNVTQTPAENLIVLLQSKTDGTLDTGWTTIATATNATSMTSLTTAIPAGTFVRLRITSKATIQPSFSVQVNGTVTA